MTRTLRHERSSTREGEQIWLTNVLAREARAGSEGKDRELTAEEKGILEDWVAESKGREDSLALARLKREQDRTLTKEDQLIIAEWEAEQDHKARGGVVVNAALSMAMTPEDADRIVNSESGERPETRY